MTRMASTAAALAASLALLLGGCAGAPPSGGGGPIPIIGGDAQPPPPPPATGPEPLPVPPPAPVVPDALPPITTNFPKTLAASGAGAPVLALARQAEAARASGLHDAALGDWQRALRIEPRNAFIWHEIAATHLALKRGDQAESAAQKSTSLARGNLWLEAQNWRLIAASRRLRFDSAGAEDALSRSDTLRARLPPP